MIAFKAALAVYFLWLIFSFYFSAYNLQLKYQHLKNYKNTQQHIFFFLNDIHVSLFIYFIFFLNVHGVSDIMSHWGRQYYGTNDYEWPKYSGALKGLASCFIRQKTWYRWSTGLPSSLPVTHIQTSCIFVFKK